jgi:hypothetical protein
MGSPGVSAPAPSRPTRRPAEEPHPSGDERFAHAFGQMPMLVEIADVDSTVIVMARRD